MDRDNPEQILCEAMQSSSIAPIPGGTQDGGELLFLRAPELGCGTRKCSAEHELPIADGDNSRNPPTCKNSAVATTVVVALYTSSLPYEWVPTGRKLRAP